VVVIASSLVRRQLAAGAAFAASSTAPAYVRSSNVRA
jgi:hypothetical protein